VQVFLQAPPGVSFGSNVAAVVPPYLDDFELGTEYTTIKAAVEAQEFTYGVFGSTIGREFLLESFHFGSKRKSAALQNLADGLVDLVRDAPVLRFEVQKRNQIKSFQFVESRTSNPRMRET